MFDRDRQMIMVERCTMSDLLYRASDEGFSADWTGAGLRDDCRDAFLRALPRSGKHALSVLTRPLRAALKAACREAYHAGYATATIDTYHRLGVMVNMDAYLSEQQAEDKVIDLIARRREKEREAPETE